MAGQRHNQQREQGFGESCSPTRPAERWQPQRWDPVMRTASEDNEQLLSASVLCGLVSQPPPKDRQKTEFPQTPQAHQLRRTQSTRSHRKVDPYRCVQCRGVTAPNSTFDHTCPVCGVVVCHNCVDDFRLIIATYRCPHCGNEKENQALLGKTAWMRKAYRSAQTMYMTFTDSWQALFAAETDHDSRCTSQPVRQQSVQELRPQGQLQKERSMPSLYSKGHTAPAAVAAASQPEFKTMLPVGWEEAGFQTRGLQHRNGMKIPVPL
jgi:predicted RNA-binding Zn-ribbon protein involved in translation (DUF1610 family)